MKICLRLRYPTDKNQFMPLENVIDTMLHELAHIIHGPHDSKFHALWDQLRDEHQGLAIKGYTGEGFLSEGNRLGGRRMPVREVNRLAREAAEKRRAAPAGTGPGRRLGGTAPRPGEDIRRVIVTAVERRNSTLRGCATDKLSDTEIRNIADTATREGSRTKAKEDEANEAAIAQALWELVQQDGKAKYGQSYIPPSAENPTGNGGGSILAGPSKAAAKIDIPPGGTAEAEVAEPALWACERCTLHNPLNFLSCEACGAEKPDVPPKVPSQSSRPGAWAAPSSSSATTTIDLTRDEPIIGSSKKPAGAAPRRAAPPPQEPPQTWFCRFCGTEMERRWWTCMNCGLMKDSSR
jgi:hypothetical protein